MVDVTVQEVESTKHTVERIIDLADPIFSKESSEAEFTDAVEAIEGLVDEAVVNRTEELRAALEAMLNNHCFRFPLSGRCRCDACQDAADLIGGRN